MSAVTAGMDISKRDAKVAVRVPGKRAGTITTTVTTWGATVGQILELIEFLAAQHVTTVVMEATSDYWKPVFYVLEAAGFQTWLVNAKDVKHLPGRAKTDRLDAVWLCKLAERQMLRPSFVPPPQIRELRDVTGYRVALVEARTAEQQRVEKLLEDAQIKLSVVASDIFGVSGRDMMAALIAGQRDRQVLDVFSVDQPRLEPGGLQHVERRLPVVAGRFHHHPGHAQLSQPVGQPRQRLRHRGMRRHLLRPGPALAGHPHATHQLGLADVQRRHPLDDLLTFFLLLQHLLLLPRGNARCARTSCRNG